LILLGNQVENDLPFNGLQGEGPETQILELFTWLPKSISVFLTDYSDRLRKVCSLSSGGGNSYNSCDSRMFLGGFASPFFVYEDVIYQRE